MKLQIYSTKGIPTRKCPNAQQMDLSNSRRTHSRKSESRHSTDIHYSTANKKTSNHWKNSIRTKKQHSATGKILKTVSHRSYSYKGCEPPIKNKSVIRISRPNRNIAIPSSKRRRPRDPTEDGHSQQNVHTYTSDRIIRRTIYRT